MAEYAELNLARGAVVRAADSVFNKFHGKPRFGADFGKRIERPFRLLAERSVWLWLALYRGDFNERAERFQKLAFV